MLNMCIMKAESLWRRMQTKTAEGVGLRILANQDHPGRASSVKNRPFVSVRHEQSTKKEVEAEA